MSDQDVKQPTPGSNVEVRLLTDPEDRWFAGYATEDGVRMSRCEFYTETTWEWDQIAAWQYLTADFDTMKTRLDGLVSEYKEALRLRGEGDKSNEAERDRYEKRIAGLIAADDKQMAEISQQTGEIARLEGDKAALKSTIENIDIEAKGRIALARQTVSAQDHKLEEQTGEIARLREQIDHAVEALANDDELSVARAYGALTEKAQPEEATDAK